MAGGDLVGDEEELLPEKVAESLRKLRIDEYRPWRYIFFVFLSSVARGIGFAMGMTIVLAIIVFIITKILTTLVNFPLVGSYFVEISELIQSYLKTMRVR